MDTGKLRWTRQIEHISEADGAGLRWESCLAYLDDIVVFGHTFDEHLEQLRAVLTRLQKANLKLNPKKCRFFEQSAHFLGQVISGKGVSTDPAKV